MSKVNIQDQLLYQARRERAPVKIYLMRGIQLQGRISGYDTYSVLLESQGRLQLIFKHAISTIDFPERLRPSGLEDRQKGIRREGASGGRGGDRKRAHDAYERDSNGAGEKPPAGAEEGSPQASAAAPPAAEVEAKAIAEVSPTPPPPPSPAGEE